ncbi:hypothetical protein [Amaricoccus macauensis]|uniref:hypothetical protein n=1 Tax=Amaricoccus macauensis TaxID=57001 RepID=UPI003C79B282
MDLTPPGIARNLLRDSTIEGIHERYIDQFPRFESSIEAFQGLKTDYDAKYSWNEDSISSRDFLNIARFLCLNYDLSTIELPAYGLPSYPFAFNKENRKISHLNPLFAMPMEAQAKLFLGYNLEVTPRFYYWKGEANTKLIEKLMPALESGRLIVRPSRANLFAYVGQDGSRETGSLVDGPDIWKLERELNYLGVKRYEAQKQDEIGLFDLCIPFIADIPFDLLHRIIEDEEDVLFELRRELREIIDKNPGMDTEEMIRDLIFPRIHALEIKYKKLMERRSIRKVACIGRASVSLLSFLLFPSLSGASSFGENSISALIEREEYNDARRSLDPSMRVLWRLRKIQTTK